MKVIKYNLCSVVTQSKEKPRANEDDPIEYECFSEEILTPVTIGWNEVNEEIAKKEAHNGEYTIEDDGQPEPIAEPSAEERLEALESAMLEMLGVNANG